MNTSFTSSTRAASQARHSFPTYFAQDSGAWAKGHAYAGASATRHAAGMPGTSFRKPGSRVSYANALYAAAVAALLSACVQSDVEVAPKETTIRVSETATGMPEVVVTASRDQPRSIG